MQGLEKNIDIDFSYTTDFITERQYIIVAILDNLITNAIDACKDTGYIAVSQAVREESLLLKVADSGCGIDKEEQDVIFDPGYSTKFCRYTGNLSTGLGLSQVKNLTEMLGGWVTVTSQQGKGAIFEVILPLRNL